MPRVAIKLSPKHSGGLFARKRIPADVQDEYEPLYGVRWEERFTTPVGASASAIRRQVQEWAAEIDTRIANIRAARKGEGQSLTREQARALAGEWYNWFVGRHLATASSAEHWERYRGEIGDELRRAVARHTPPYADPEDPEADDIWEHSEEAREAVRPMLADWCETSRFLAMKGLTLDTTSRVLFLDFLYDDFAAALALLIRRARGDFSPDTHPPHFPKFAVGGLSAWDLFRRWIEAAGPAESTVNRWRAVFLALKEQFGDRNIASLTFEEARDWINGLIRPGRTATTVADVWLVAARTVCAWGVTQKYLASNPFAEVKVTVPKKAKLRESEAFTPEETQIILQAASAITVGKSKFEAAKRWVPWLCAYSGARVGEITQLRAGDIIERDGIHAMRLTPEAGTIKTGQARVVPLHEHLVVQRFLVFVSSKGKGPLFYNLSKLADDTDKDATNPKRPRSVKARERLAKWVRSLGITDPELRPNHAWRHTFKQIADRAGITERMSNYITGHAHTSEGAKYGAPTVDDMAKALRRFPRYKLK
jgi:integrase